MTGIINCIRKGHQNQTKPDENSIKLNGTGDRRTNGLRRQEGHKQLRGASTNGSASDSRSEGWAFESLVPHFSSFLLWCVVLLFFIWVVISMLLSFLIWDGLPFTIAKSKGQTHWGSESIYVGDEEYTCGDITGQQASKTYYRSYSFSQKTTIVLYK
ncbi:hypothetical protein PHYBLDRAFT_71390 [Phycomyces blakesleeanus NRRL 1555(-)]|uniref:Uncharacterized protein n=1 Tax=Phycomyces blakesleeanus (strain ATCC 8743b / DSM 1359 / FGSC 10004 / NBRC 33097 / NRRL 1555) TaxID=763407 RepID=A0A162NHL9_PHYB8|nr:hypothetical protein PHYBLDRAFT_71390 [Phycomyces blakesleeanus NRRL 1555(-)]OAD74348.1 hypothetical protein PHYBLDRAFT_71390 [Phycomyces blakesleeanus NRRL 1555(-)]|eukprot:XP_018292388.1 hypothetical protein PHYBLDRAFT_71390 [Phycomyces blakesleeanus NRRL 1555(-)]